MLCWLIWVNNVQWICCLTLTFVVLPFWTFRENTVYWKVKEIDSMEQRAKGYCPLTPKEVGIFLTALGFPSKTPIYIAAGEIYGGDSHMAELQSRYPLLMNKVCHGLIQLFGVCALFLYSTSRLLYVNKNELQSNNILSTWRNTRISCTSEFVLVNL